MILKSEIVIHKVIRSFLMLLVFGTAPFAFGLEGDAKVMRIHTTSSPGHQIAMALHLFALDVAKRSDGEVRVEIVSRSIGEIVPPPIFVESVADGTIEAACMPNFIWTRHIPEMNFSLIPYFFTRENQIRDFPASRAAAFLESKINEQGVRTLSWLHVTRMSAFTSANEPLVGIDDFKDLRIRTLNDFGLTVFRAAGATPVNLVAGDVRAAISDGKIDAVMTDVSSSTGGSYSLYEVHKHATIAPFFSAFYHLFVSPQWLDGLSGSQRSAVIEAGRELDSTAFLITEARAADSLDVMRANGMQVHIQTPRERQAWQNAMQKVSLDAFTDSFADGAKLVELLEEI
jgi:C4-dicarboxylate-binding protein DctP